MDERRRRAGRHDPDASAHRELLRGGPGVPLTLIADLPTMAVGEVPEARRAQAAQLGDELRRTRFELPDGYESLAFHVLGRRKGPFRLPRSHELAVISPFVRAEALELLRETTGRLVAVIARPEELDALPAEARALAEGCWTLDDAAEVEDGESSEQRDTLGLHAKALVLRCGWDTKLFVGSANATSAALCAGMNLEVLAELTGKRSKVKQIEDLLGPGGLGPALSPYVAPDAPAPVDAAEQAATQALEAARDVLACAPLRVRCDREEDGFRLVVVAQEAIPLEGIAGLRAWPLTVTQERAADAASLMTTGNVPLGRFATATTTGLIAFELTAVASRLTLLPTKVHELSKNPINFVSFTPGTTFDLKSSGGVMMERALVYRMLKEEPWLKQRGLLNALQCTAGRESWERCANDWEIPFDEALAEKYRAAVRDDPALRARVVEICERFDCYRQHVPRADSEVRYALVGDLRHRLAATCLHELEPDLVILDELQRFRDLLDGDDEAAALARDLFSYPGVRVLLLSATPYKMLALDHEQEDDHYPDFLRTLGFLFRDPVEVESVKAEIQRFRRALYALAEGDDSGVAAALLDAGAYPGLRAFCAAGG